MAGEPECLPDAAEAAGEAEVQVPRPAAWSIGVLQDTEGCFLSGSLGSPVWRLLELIRVSQGRRIPWVVCPTKKTLSWYIKVMTHEGRFQKGWN